MSSYADRLAALRAQLAADRLDGFVVPLTDEHMSEYVGSYAQRLQWLTGFEGSAGSAVVLPEEAAIFVDGRYTLQVRSQVSADHWSYQSVPETSIADWLKEHAGQGARIGYDPWLHSRDWVKRATEALAAKGAELVAVRAQSDRRGVGRPPGRFECQADRPPREIRRPVRRRQAPADRRMARQAKAPTRRCSRRSIRSPGLSTSAAPTSRTRRSLWLMPWSMPTAPPTCSSPARRSTPRSASISATAFVFTSAPISKMRLASSRASASRSIPSARSRRSSMRSTRPGRRSSACAIRPCFRARSRMRSKSPGQRSAQARDGVAIARFLKWVGEEAPKGGLDELKASDRLEALRRESGELRDLSFDTISGAGPNGAIVHYRASEATNRPLEPGSLYLVDSGGQYADGTTDITRTRGDRHSDRRNARPLHACAEGPYRHRHRALPQGHPRQPARQLRPPRLVGCRARLCPWHRPRRRQLPCRSTKGRSAFRRWEARNRAATSRSPPA